MLEKSKTVVRTLNKKKRATWFFIKKVKTSDILLLHFLVGRWLAPTYLSLWVFFLKLGNFSCLAHVVWLLSNMLLFTWIKSIYHVPKIKSQIVYWNLLVLVIISVNMHKYTYQILRQANTEKIDRTYEELFVRCWIFWQVSKYFAQK